MSWSYDTTVPADRQQTAGGVPGQAAWTQQYNTGAPIRYNPSSGLSQMQLALLDEAAVTRSGDVNVPAAALECTGEERLQGRGKASVARHEPRTRGQAGIPCSQTCQGKSWGARPGG